MAEFENKENTATPPENVPYIVHESEVARLERIIVKLWGLAVLLALLLVGTNVGWIIYEAQFQEISVEQDIDTGEGDAVIAGVGDVYYGENQAAGEDTP